MNPNSDRDVGVLGVLQDAFVHFLMLILDRTAERERGLQQDFDTDEPESLVNGLFTYSFTSLDPDEPESLVNRLHVMESHSQHT